LIINYYYRALKEETQDGIQQDLIHHWTDYRDWGEVVATWQLGPNRDSQNDQTRIMGEYIPGIT